MFETVTMCLVQHYILISPGYGKLTFILDFQKYNSLKASQNGRLSPTKNPMMHSDVQALFHHVACPMCVYNVYVSYFNHCCAAPLGLVTIGKKGDFTSQFVLFLDE